MSTPSADRSRERPLVSIVVPVYNEAPILERNVAVLIAYLNTLEDRYRWEIIIIDDGSEDDTGEITDRLAAVQPHVRVYHHHVNFNLGQALRYGFRNCRGDYVVSYDIDLSYSPDHIGRMLAKMVETRAKVVVTSPYMKGGTVSGVPWHRMLLSKVANRFLSLVSKSGMSTVTGMVRAYDRRFIQGLDLKAMDNEINSEIIYKAELLRARVTEIPGHLRWTRGTGKSRRTSSMHISRVTEGFAFSGFIFRPFMFFIIPGLFIGALAVYTLGWVFYHVVSFYAGAPGGFDPRLSFAVRAAWEHSPYSFIVGGIALLVSIQLLSLGILSAQSKRYFEELFHLGTTVLHRLPMLPAADQRNGLPPDVLGARTDDSPADRPRSP